MTDQIPEGITREHIIKAISALTDDVEHQFSESTGYDVLYDGQRYPPKAVVGIASSYVTGKQLGPYDFKGGLKSKCFKVLESNEFQIITKGDTSPFPDEIGSTATHLEGSVIQTVVNRYERDTKARSKCIEAYGAVCQVCTLDFEKVYGPIGEGFIHVHHIKQLSDIAKEYEVNPTSDLVPVCPNCHAMLHKKRPPFSIDELKAMLCATKI